MNFTQTLNTVTKPLIISTSGSLLNPSILSYKGKLYVNIRSCQYVLHHAEKLRFPHRFGPLVYLNPENDVSLRSVNYLCELDDSLNIVSSKKIDTSSFDTPPAWNFIGLEDCRLVCWDDKLYLCGVRRDTKSNGEGRMELSEICVKSGRELSRVRIPAPAPNTSYCEKNWMPILDSAYTWLKWSNPVEIVTYDGSVTKTTMLGDAAQFSRDLRGGGQVIPFKDGYLSLCHVTYLYRSETAKKNAVYKHKFVHYNKDWEVVSSSDEFSFMGADIEFAAGLAQKDDRILVTFGFQDNAAFISSTPLTTLEALLCNN